MQLDKEKVRELACKYAGWCEAARRSEEEMDAARREARAVMDEMAEYLDQVNAADKAMEEELARLRKAEAERAEASEAVAALHTCRECRFLQRGTKNGLPQVFCLVKPHFECNETDAACNVFQPSIAKLAEEVSLVHSLYIHTCGECLSWAEDKMEFNGMGTCLNRNCETVKRGEMDPSCFYFEPREEPAAKTGKPTEEGPEVSCLECKHAERVDAETNTWKCTAGFEFAGFGKIDCCRYEERA